MGMYHYLTINLRVNPLAPPVVHRVLAVLCGKPVFSTPRWSWSELADQLHKGDVDSGVLNHRFFSDPRWTDIFGNWSGDSHDWAWADKEPIAQYHQSLLTVRCSFKSTYLYENFIDWIKPYLTGDSEDCVFSWYEEFKGWDHPPKVFYGNLDAVVKISPLFNRKPNQLDWFQAESEPSVVEN